jgi:GntR family transcriptional regulator, rspAB operon transcriptional repressor
MKSVSRVKTNRSGESETLRNMQPRTLTERVYAALKRDIITGVLRPGQAFSEKDLADHYDASRTPVREAAVRLQVEGLVRIIANRGYFVTQLTIQGMNDLYEYRAAVESACVELLCGARISPRALAELEAVASFRAEQEERYGDFIKADTAFHVGLAQLTHNVLMVQSVSQMRALTERILFAAADAIELRYYGDVPAREHAAIMQAIRDNDPQLGRRLMREHIIGSKSKMLELAGRDSRFLSGASLFRDKEL